MPAHQSKFSEHDKNVRNLRRYNRKSFAKVIDKIPELEIMEEREFFFSLLMVRFVKKSCVYL